jgi:predicted RNA-binding Zn-ribbon protein involved in translation (DUF1610 family)
MKWIIIVLAILVGGSIMIKNVGEYRKVKKYRGYLIRFNTGTNEFEAVDSKGNVLGNAEYISFVEGVVDGCIEEDNTIEIGKNFKYHPELGGVNMSFGRLVFKKEVLFEGDYVCAKCGSVRLEETRKTNDTTPIYRCQKCKYVGVPKRTPYAGSASVGDTYQKHF